MISTQVIKDFGGRIIGYIDSDDKGNKTIKDFYKKILGYYDAKTNTTLDFHRRIIARGDASGMLLYSKNN